MDKTNKELAVELAKYVVLASVLKNNDSTKKPLTGEDVQNILKDATSPCVIWTKECNFLSAQSNSFAALLSCFISFFSFFTFSRSFCIHAIQFLPF